MKIFVVGSGKLANALLASDLSFSSCEITKWDPIYQTLNEKAIIVHAGSGRQLEECLTFCFKTKSIIIELSTGLGTEQKEPDFPLIICQNTSILVLKTLCMMRANSKYFENYEISITESHQSNKKTEPGTAIEFAKSLNISPTRILSIRDREVQQNEIGISKDYLEKHAYHKIVIKDGLDEMSIETKVLGHSSYAKGVRQIIEGVLRYDLLNKKYLILDLINSGILNNS